MRNCESSWRIAVVEICLYTLVEATIVETGLWRLLRLPMAESARPPY